MKTTPNLGLKKPDQEDFYNVDDFNYNADKLDEEVARRIVNAGGVPSIQAGLDANKPIPGTAGRLYVATDTQMIYRDTGTAWQKVGVVKWDDIEGKPDLALASDLAAHLAEKATHGVESGYYIAKTSRSDQLPAWNDIQGKPLTFTPAAHTHSGSDITSPVANATNATTWQNIGWVKPGNTVLITSASEAYHSDSFYVPLKVFSVLYPGRYRINGKIRSSHQDYTATIVIGMLYHVGRTASYSIIFGLSNTFSTTSTTYVDFSLDMIHPVPLCGTILLLGKSNNSNGGVYVSNVSVCYASGASSDASSNAELTRID